MISVTVTDGKGNILDEFTVDEGPTVANAATIRDRAAQALATNTTFLAIASPSNAQLAAQVKALTRQNNGLIRLVLNRFDGTD